MAVTTTKLSILDKAAIVRGGRSRWPSLGPSGRWPLPETKAMPIIWPDWRDRKPQWHVINLDAYINEGFNLNSLIYSAIMFKVRAMMRVLLKAYTGDADHPEPLDAAHPLTKLLARPNPHQSYLELQGQTIVYFNLDGNAYITYDRPARAALPEAFYSIRPDHIYIIPDRKQAKTGLLGYVYVPEGKNAWGRWDETRRREALRNNEVLLFAPEDLMHVKLPNPGDPLQGLGYGLSPLSAAAHSADVDNKVTEFLKLFFDHGAMPMGLLKFDVPMTDDTVARARDRWQEIYGGYVNWSDVAVLDQGGSYQRITPTFEEMGFESIDARNASRILGPFGVPGMLISERHSLDRSTYSNWEQANKAVWENTLVPEATFFEVEWKYYLRTDDAFVAYDFGAVPALREDLNKKVDAWSAMVDRGVPKDVAAGVADLPLPQLPDDGVGYLPLNLVPTGMVAPTPATTEQGAASATEEERGEGKALTWEDLKKNRLNGPRVGG